jgi:toxin FitB
VNFLLDTNVVSEWTRPQPDATVVSWLAGVDEDRVFLSVVTLAELRYGIERLALGRRRTRLEEWLTGELPLRFEGRVLPIDHAIADGWGKVAARSEAQGKPMDSIDAFLAATAEVHGLMLVTRNSADFEPVLKDLFNPWTQR